MSPPNSMVAFVVPRLGSAIRGALGLGLALAAVLMHLDRILHPDNPDAGQLGALGAAIGLPLGFIFGWMISQHPQSRRVFLASSIGTFLGGMVGGYAAAIVATAGPHLKVTGEGADSTGARIGGVIGLLFALFGLVVGWFLARRWPRLRREGQRWSDERRLAPVAELHDRPEIARGGKQ